jgi:hypothetical protein
MWREQTIIQTYDPSGGGQPVPLLAIEGVSLPLDPYMRLTIDDVVYDVLGRRDVAIRVGARSIVTTITVDRRS